MTNYGDRDDDRDVNRNKDTNDDNNAVSRSGSDGLIFDPITTPWSCEEDWAMTATGAAAVLQYTSVIVNMCYKLLYVKFGILDWCCCPTKKIPALLIRE